MGIPVEQLMQEVLRLPPRERARLLDRVIDSLDADARRDAAWDELAATRDQQANEDASLLLNGPDLVSHLRAELG